MSVPNFCKPDTMSTCTAGSTYKDHKKCHFAEKASRHNRCMYFNGDEDDNFCDCLKAQQAEYNPVESMQMPIVKREMPVIRGSETIPKNLKVIDVQTATIKKICTIDHATICARSWCHHYDHCKEPIKNQ